MQVLLVEHQQPGLAIAGDVRALRRHQDPGIARQGQCDDVGAMARAAAAGIEQHHDGPPGNQLPAIAHQRENRPLGCRLLEFGARTLAQCACRPGTNVRTNKKPRGPGGGRRGQGTRPGEGPSFRRSLQGMGEIRDRPCICHGLYDQTAHG